MNTSTTLSSSSAWPSFPGLKSYIRPHTWLPLGLLLVIATLLRIPHLTEPLWYDELWSTSLKLKNFVSLAVTILLDPHPPFYASFMYFWTGLFGDSELAIRMPPLIFGLLSILIVYHLALKSFGKRAAFLASFFMCTSPVHIWYSQEARPYSATAFLLLVSIFSYYQISKLGANSRRWFFIYFLSLLFAVFSHYYVSVFLGVLSVVAVFEKNAMKKRILFCNIFIFVSLILCILLKDIFGRFLTGTAQNHLRPFTIFELYMLFFNWFLTGNSLWNNMNLYQFSFGMLFQRPAILFFQTLFLIGFLKGLVSLIRDKNGGFSIHVVFYLFSLPFFLWGLTLIGFRNIYIERSLFIILPFFYLILAKGLSNFSDRTVTATVVIFIIVFNTISLVSFYRKSNEWTVYKPNPDWRAAAHYFQGQLLNIADQTLIFATSKATELTYYDHSIAEFRDEEIQGFAQRKIDKLGQLIGENGYLFKRWSFEIHKYVESLIEVRRNARAIIYYEGESEGIQKILGYSETDVIYLIHNRYWSAGFKRLLGSVMADLRFNLLEEQSFKGIDIYKFGVAAAASQ